MLEKVGAFAPEDNASCHMPCIGCGLAGGSWDRTRLAEFDIHEGAFGYLGGTPVVFEDIPGFLQKKDGRWVYSDYSQNGYGTMENVGRMKEPEIASCGNST